MLGLCLKETFDQARAAKNKRKIEKLYKLGITGQKLPFYLRFNLLDRKAVVARRKQEEP